MTLDEFRPNPNLSLPNKSRTQFLTMRSSIPNHFMQNQHYISANSQKTHHVLSNCGQSTTLKNDRLHFFFSRPTVQTKLPAT